MGSILWYSSPTSSELINNMELGRGKYGRHSAGKCSEEDWVLQMGLKLITFEGTSQSLSGKSYYNMDTTMDCFE